MSITQSIDAFATGTYTVTRLATGSRVNGEWVPGAPSTFPINASIQPLSGRELMALPEGRRTVENKLVLTTTEIHDGDTIAIGSETFEVYQVENWDAFGQLWFEAFASKQDVP